MSNLTEINITMIKLDKEQITFFPVSESGE